MPDSGRALLASRTRDRKAPRLDEDSRDQAANQLGEAVGLPTQLTFATVLRLQRTVGNAAVQRLLASRAPAPLGRPIILQRQDGDQGSDAQALGGPNSNQLDQLNLAAPVTLKENPLLPGDVSKVGGKKYVIYDDEVRQGGTVAWVCRNPGNIRNGDSYGAYPGKKYHTGSVGDFAIFPDETTGYMAIISVLQGYGHVTVAQAMNKYAPAGDGANDPDAYARTVARRMGVKVDTYVDTLADEQMAMFADAIKTVEGWKPGNTFARDDPKLPQEIRDHL